MHLLFPLLKLYRVFSNLRANSHCLWVPIYIVFFAMYLIDLQGGGST